MNSLKIIILINVINIRNTSIKRVLYVLCLLLTSAFCFSQDTDVISLVKQRKYTDLQKQLENSNLSKENRIYIQSVVNNVFGKPQQSKQLLEQFFRRGDLPDSLIFALTKVLNDSYVKLFEYANAYKSQKYLLDRFPRYFSPDELEEETRVMNIWKALKSIPKQVTRSAGDAVLPMTRNYLGLQTLPVTINAKSEDFVFDTGAGFSTVTESFAVRTGLRVLQGEPVVIRSGVTGTGTLVKLGIADKLVIGNTSVRNVVCLIFPDSSLTFKLPDSSFRLDAVLGFPVIKELGMVNIYPDKIEIKSPDQKVTYEPNMAIDLLKPIIFLKYNGKELPFTFDSGASETILSEVFYKEFKSLVDSIGNPKNVSVGGAGGLRTMQMVLLPGISFECLGEKIIMKEVNVSKDVLKTANSVYYGNIGQDMIRQFQSMTINFKDSWVRFNDK
jgi:hypothetical protein